MDCPKCQFEQPFETDECVRCGIIFARCHQPSEASCETQAAPAAVVWAAAGGVMDSASVAMPGSVREQPAEDPDSGAADDAAWGFAEDAAADAADTAEAAPSHGIDALGRQALGVGFGLAIATQFIGFLEMLIGYMVVLVHEMGHALAGWLFGYVSIPAFDFTYGGGVTTHQEVQSLALVGIVLAGFAVLGWAFRGNPVSFALSMTLAAAYAALAFSDAHHVLIVAMGHGAELCFAAIFIQRALTGRACQLDVERPLYAWIGFHIVLVDIAFARGLATSALARQQYADAKGGGHWMDFSRLAHEHLGVSLESVATGFGLLCVVTPVLAFGFAWLGPERAWLREQLGRV
jgi:hypothetical protein